MKRAVHLLQFPPHEGYGRLDIMEVMKDLRLWKSDGMDTKLTVLSLEGVS